MIYSSNNKIGLLHEPVSREGRYFDLSVAPPWGYGRPGVTEKKAGHFFY
jgi:hypothetical protein